MFRKISLGLCLLVACSIQSAHPKPPLAPSTPIHRRNSLTPPTSPILSEETACGAGSSYAAQIGRLWPISEKKEIKRKSPKGIAFSPVTPATSPSPVSDTEIFDFSVLAQQRAALALNPGDLKLRASVEKEIAIFHSDPSLYTNRKAIDAYQKAMDLI